MDEANQIEPPPSFLALYASLDGARLVQPPAFVIARYELCEDLALSVAQRLGPDIPGQGDDFQSVLHRVRDALAASSALSDPETGWVLARIAELSDGQMR